MEELSLPRPDSKRRSGLPALVAGAMLLLPVLYVLSTGPVARMLIGGQIGEETFDAIYKPLIWAAESSEMVEGFFVWYCQLFLPDEFQIPP